MIINYGDPDINLLTRKALPGAIKNDLNKNPAWASWRTLRHKQPPIEAWLQTHHGLLKTMSKIETATAALMDVQPSELNRAIRFCNLLEGCQHLVLHLEQHQIVEDQIYFPKFVAIIPRLKAPIEMLDHDHIVLEQLMHDANNVLDKLATMKPKRADIARLHQITARLHRGLKTHIQHEEDIIMPDLLEIGIERLLID